MAGLAIFGTDIRTTVLSQRRGLGKPEAKNR
jgi:hypothetical protein